MSYPLPHIHCKQGRVLINSHTELITTIKSATFDDLPALATTIKSATFSEGHLSIVHAWELKLSKYGFPHGHGVTEYLAQQNRNVSANRQATLDAEVTDLEHKVDHLEATIRQAPAGA